MKNICNFKFLFSFIFWLIVELSTCCITLFLINLVFIGLTASYTFLVFALIFCCSYLFDFSLYIYSYYVYFGKNNWYKFFREKEKAFKKQCSLEYKEYIKKR